MIISDQDPDPGPTGQVITYLDPDPTSQVITNPDHDGKKVSDQGGYGTVTVV